MIEKAEGDGRTPLIDELVTALRGHMALEEAVLYPVMGPVTGPEDVQEGNAEHPAYLPAGVDYGGGDTRPFSGHRGE